MQNYQMWLNEEQKQQVLKYIQDRRYQYMMNMYIAIGYAVFVDICYLTALVDSIEIIIHCIIATLVSFFLIFHGTGKIFGKNSDYGCVKQDNYILNIRKFAEKQPDSGKYPYFVDDFYGNSYQCINFLDWKHAHAGDMLICIQLKNGQKYAILQKVILEK